MTILRNDQENSYEYFEEVCKRVNKMLNKKALAGIEQELPFTGATIILDDSKYMSIYSNDDNRLVIEIGQPENLAVIPLTRYMSAVDAANVLVVAYHSATI